MLKLYRLSGIGVVSRGCRTATGWVFFLPSCSFALSLTEPLPIVSFPIYERRLFSRPCGKCLNLTGRSFDKLRQQRTCLPPTPDFVHRVPFVQNLIIFYALVAAAAAATLCRCVFTVNTDTRTRYIRI